MYQIAVWEANGQRWRMRKLFDTVKEAADYAIKHVAEHRTWRVVAVARWA